MNSSYPVFPAHPKSKLPTEELTVLSQLQYFMAHAPRVPNWFLISHGEKNIRRSRFDPHTYTETEECFFAWRLYYAHKMLDLKHTDK